MDFPKKQQQSLIPRYLLQYLQDLQITHTDPTAPWGGGGGGSYTAGDGIDITNDVISVDTNVIATKSDIPTNYVTTDTYQVITGQKQINNAFNFGDGDHNNIMIDANYVNRPLIAMINDTTGVEFNIGVDDSGTETPVNGAYFSHTDDNGERYYTLPHQDATGLNTYTLATTSDLPTKTSDLTNDSGYITSSALTGYATETWVSSELLDYAELSDLATVATTGDYNDLTNKPTIPDAVSGTNDGTNWTSLTIGNTTYNIPSGGGASYSAGTGIDITNNTIAIDSTVVALKSDIPSTANFVDLTNNQNITGIKTFVGKQLLRFKQNSTSDTLGFTAYDNNNNEIGNLQIADRTVGGNTYTYVTLGNWSSYSLKSKVGFRIQPNGSSSSYNFVMPSGNTSDFSNNGYKTTADTTIPCAFTDGTTTVNANSNGLVRLSALHLGSSVSGTYSGQYWTSLTIDGRTHNIPSGGGGGGTTVSGTNDGTNWTSITIGSDTYGIPSGGGGGGSSLAPQIYNFTSADWTGTNTNGYIHSNAMSREGLDLSTLSAGQTIKIDCIFVRPSNNTSYVHQFTLVIPDGTMATESTDTFQIPGTNQTNLQIEAWMQISNNRIGLFWSNSSQTRYISKVKVYPVNA